MVAVQYVAKLLTRECWKCLLDTWEEGLMQKTASSLRKDEGFAKLLDMLCVSKLVKVSEHSLLH